MLLSGDEMGRTQGGNNNAYCQDNEISWFDWADTDDDLLEFTRRADRLRRDHPVFRRRRWFQGRPIQPRAPPTSCGSARRHRDDRGRLERAPRRRVGMFLNGEAIAAPGPAGRAGGRLVPAAVQRLGHEPRTCTDSRPWGELAARSSTPPATEAPRTAACGRPGRDRPLPRAAPPGPADGRSGRLRGQRRRIAAAHGDRRPAGRHHVTPARHLPAPAPPRVRLRRRRRGRAGTWRSWGCRTSTCRRCCRRRPGRPTATTSSTTPGERRPRGRRRRTRRLVAAIAPPGLGQVLDIVPNHMAITGPENRWWWDVLENGPSSRVGRPLRRRPGTRPRRSCATPSCCRSWATTTGGCSTGARSRSSDGGPFTVRYFEHTLPVDPDRWRRCWPGRPSAPATTTSASWPPPSPPARGPPAPTRPRGRAPPGQEVLRRQLAGCWTSAAGGRRGGRRWPVNADVDALDALLDAQNYRIAYWRTPADELDYRRFFDIDTWRPAGRGPRGVRRHPRAGPALGARRRVDGLRIDHPDGLRDPRSTPTGWRATGDVLRGREDPRAGRGPARDVAGRRHHRLRPAGVVGGLFVDPAGEEPLTEVRTRSPATTDVDEVVHEPSGTARAARALAADVDRLTALLGRDLRAAPPPRPHPPRAARRPCARCSPPSRSTGPTCRPTPGVVRPEDATGGDGAVGGARRPTRHRPELLDFLADLLLLECRRAALEDEWAMRFQQLTGPVMAKGVEDTAFYRYNRCSPQRGGRRPGPVRRRVDEFHAANAAAQAGGRPRCSPSPPTTPSAARTCGPAWRCCRRSRTAWAACGRWMAAQRPALAGGEPDRHAQHLYQTLVGAWPLAGRPGGGLPGQGHPEAKLRTSWTEPDPDYDAARDAFVAAVSADEPSPPTSTRSSPRWSAPAGQRPGPGAAADGARRARHLPGHRAVGPEPRRPRQPPAGRLRRRAGCSPSAPTAGRPEDGLPGRDEGLPKLALVRAALDLPAPAARGVRRRRGGAYLPLLRRARRRPRGGLHRGGAVAVVGPAWCSASAGRRRRAGHDR